MNEANKATLSLLLEKGYVEYLGLFLVFAGILWIGLSILDGLQLICVGYDMFNRVAAALVYGGIGIFSVVFISSLRTLQEIREHQRQQKQN